MSYPDYVKNYQGVDFQKHPELYRVGRGEQGVLMAEPYKSELVKHWRFRTPQVARESSRTLYEMFERYIALNDFVGADMARKYLMMGWTRARRYANHPSGRKYQKGTRIVLPLAEDAWTSDKAIAARIFKEVYDRARTHDIYLLMKEMHKANLSVYFSQDV